MRHYDTHTMLVETSYDDLMMIAYLVEIVNGYPRRDL